AADPVRVEEAALAGLRRAVALSYRRPPRDVAGARDRDLAAAVQEHLATRFTQRLTLADLARAAGCSAFHLCRAFRRATGGRLHAYIDALRLRRALELVPQPRGHLTAPPQPQPLPPRVPPRLRRAAVRIPRPLAALSKIVTAARRAAGQDRRMRWPALLACLAAACAGRAPATGAPFALSGCSGPEYRAL